MISVLYMWEPRRQNLIAEHKFYVSEGKRRLTDQFSDKSRLQLEADEFSNTWLERAGRHFNPDQDDEGSFHEQAYDEGVKHFAALDELGNAARLALISGMFHLWERSLREWLTSNDCFGHFQVGDELPKSIWASNFTQVLELFAGAGLFQGSCSIRGRLDICRMVVNTYKHGSGSSADQLKTVRPDLFDQYGWRLNSQHAWYANSADYTDLYVQDSVIDEFSIAIEEFWRLIPEHIFDGSFRPVPKWFEKAHNKDLKGV